MKYAPITIERAEAMFRTGTHRHFAYNPEQKKWFIVHPDYQR